VHHVSQQLGPGLLNPLNEQIGLLEGDDDYVVFVIKSVLD